MRKASLAEIINRLTLSDHNPRRQQKILVFDKIYRYSIIIEMIDIQVA
jgi:hypothetical protein